MNGAHTKLLHTLWACQTESTTLKIAHSVLFIFCNLHNRKDMSLHFELHTRNRKFMRIVSSAVCIAWSFISLVLNQGLWDHCKLFKTSFLYILETCIFSLLSMVWKGDSLREMSSISSYAESHCVHYWDQELQVFSFHLFLDTFFVSPCVVISVCKTLFSPTSFPHFFYLLSVRFFLPFLIQFPSLFFPILSSWPSPVSSAYLLPTTVTLCNF